MQNNKSGRSVIHLNSGITLIELMIVVVIVGILAAIAYPSYTAQVQKGKRSDGIAALLNVAQAQERFYSRNFTYGSNLQTQLGFNATPYKSEEGNYDVTIVIPAACVSGAVRTCFTAVATAVGPQADDTTCATMTINDRGQKTSADSGGNSTTGQCW